MHAQTSMHEAMTSRRVLITGGGGQLAGALYETATADVVVHGLASADLDITEGQAVHDVLADLRPDVVVNTAAYNDVDGAESNTAHAFNVNGEGPAHLARSCARF